MSRPIFARRAARELRDAAAYIAADNPDAARRLQREALAAARRVTANPMLARVELRLAPPRFRFWSLRPFPYLLVIDTQLDPPVITRFVHAARDLPVVLREL